jgi:hypothetical protein
MPRPQTITGLLSLWLRGRPRRRPGAASLAAASLALALASAIGLGSCRDRCRVQQSWSAGVAEFDYLQSLDLTRSSRGRYTFGHSQLVRFDMEFRYRVRRADELELSEFVEIDHDGRRYPRDWPARRVRFDISKGNYCFDPPYDRRRCFACRLELRGLRMPGDYEDYYGCPK